MGGDGQDAHFGKKQIEECGAGKEERLNRNGRWLSDAQPNYARFVITN